MPSENSPNELQEIVGRAQDGSLEDFQRLYDQFSRPVFNFVWRLVGSLQDAEDLTQETFLKVHKELKSLRDPAQFKFWLYRIARNEVYQKLRRSKKSSEVAVETDDGSYYDFIEDSSPGMDPEEQYISQELQSLVHGALDDMPPKYRDVFILAVFQKESYDNITKIVGRSLLSVKTDIYRARLMIRDCLSDYLKKSK